MRTDAFRLHALQWGKVVFDNWKGSALYRRSSLKLLSVSALLVASLATMPCLALAAPDPGIVSLGEDAIEASVRDGALDQGLDDEVVHDPSADDTSGDFADCSSPEAPRNGIPTVTVFVNENDDAMYEASMEDGNSYVGFDELIQSESHDLRVLGSVGITVPEGYTGVYGSSDVPEGKMQLAFMRGRGNSTWGDGYKKPFKLKFQNKQSFFGMEEAKEWALMASAFDETLLDNRIASWIGHQMGLPYTPQMVPVDLVVVRIKDGEEIERTRLGSYCLSELVEVGPNRLDIGKLGDDVTSENPDDEENITGGYLLSIFHSAQDWGEPSYNRFELDGDRILYGRGPEFDDWDVTEGREKQHDYIYNYLKRVDELVMGEDHSGETFIDKERHDAIAELMDLDSAADYWWTQVFSKNKDGFYTSSTYLYKPRGGKLCWGPVWDFDQAFERDVEGYCVNKALWLDALRMHDPRFAKLLRDRWLDPENGFNVKMAELTAEGGQLDILANEIRESWEEDNEIYPDKVSPFRELMHGTFDETIAWLRDWIDSRRDWINDHFDGIGVASIDQPTFDDDGDPAFICDNHFGSILYGARVVLPDVMDDDIHNSHMTFTVCANADGDRGKQRVVEVPFDQATLSSDAEGRSIATFVLPLTSIELGQTVKSVFCYKDGGEDASIEKVESMEGQVTSFVDGGSDEVRVAYARALHDFGRTAYGFFATHGNGNVTTDRYSPMSGCYTQTFDRANSKAAILQDLENLGAYKHFEDSRIKKVSMSLRFDSEVTVEINVLAYDGVRNFDASANFKGKKYDSERISDTKRRIRISGLRAQDLGALIDVYGDADGPYHMSCSTMSYAAAVMESGAYGEAGDDFMAALFNYYKAAKEITG